MSGTHWTPGNTAHAKDREGGLSFGLSCYKGPSQVSRANQEKASAQGQNLWWLTLDTGQGGGGKYKTVGQELKVEAAAMEKGGARRSTGSSQEPAEGGAGVAGARTAFPEL